MTTAHEYTFDVKMFAVVTVRADDERTGRAIVLNAIDASELSRSRNNPLHAKKVVRSCTYYVDDESGPWLLEIDGREVD